MPRFLDRLLGRPAHVREPRFADHFYPADPRALSALVARHLEPSSGPRGGEGRPPAALIVPGCQLDVSLAVASGVWQQVARHRDHYAKVVLLSSAQRVPFQGLAVSGKDAWRSPLGDLWLSEFDLERLGSLAQVRLLDAIHDTEAGLEVQLPVLWHLWGKGITILPLLLGDGGAGTLGQVLEQLWPADAPPGQAVLLVVVTQGPVDVSPREALGLLGALDEAIRSGDPTALTPSMLSSRVPVTELLHAAVCRGLQGECGQLTHTGALKEACDLVAFGQDQGLVMGLGSWVFS